jgi:hypothetical protein
MRRWAVAAIVVAWVSVAHARDGIVLESYEGARPQDAAKTLAPLLGDLSQRGFEAGDSIGRLYEGKVSRPLQNSLPKNFAQQLKDGQLEYIRGNYAAAVAKLGPLIDAAHDNSGAFAKNQALRQTMLDGLIALALAQDRNGDPKTARATFEELARSFPGAAVPADTWGPSAAKQFAVVQRDIAQQSQGRLIVKAPSTAEVYVNERFEQNGNVVKNFLPGEYRIFARDGSKQSRTYRVKVSSAVDASVSIDLDLDAALNTTAWTGFQYANGDRERFEAKHAAAVALAIEERAVVVVGIDAKANVIFGALVSLSGKDERRATVALTASDASKHQLARFLAGDPASDDIVVLKGPGAPGNTKIIEDTGGGNVVVPGPRETKSRWGGWPIITGIATLGAAGAAVYFFSVDGDCTDGSSNPQCPKFVERSPHAFASVGAGAVLAGITVYLIVTRSPSSKSTAYVVPANGGAMAGVSLRF